MVFDVIYLYALFIDTIKMFSLKLILVENFLLDLA
jgi:hypothetical protein